MWCYLQNICNYITFSSLDDTLQYVMIVLIVRNIQIAKILQIVQNIQIVYRMFRLSFAKSQYITSTLLVTAGLPERKLYSILSNNVDSIILTLDNLKVKQIKINFSN